MKKVFIKAYTENNLGDDLFVYMLALRYPNCEFLLPCSIRYRNAFKPIKNLKFIPIIPFVDGALARIGVSFRVKRAYYRHLMAQCDATVHIGGSLFIEYMFPHTEIDQYMQDVEASNRYYLLGSNFGPYKTQAFYEQIHDLFSHFEDVCVRDQATYDLFKDLDNVRLAPDIVFGLDTTSLNTPIQKKNQVVISVIQLKGRPGLEEHQEAYEDKLSHIATKLIDQGKKVVFMSFCKREGDEEAINRIIAKLPPQAQDRLQGPPPTQAYLYSDDIKSALEIIAESSAVIASRFHAMILAWVFGCNVYPLVYSSKMTSVLEDVRFEGDYSEIQQIEGMNIDRVVEQLEDCPPIDIARYAEAATEHFAKLDEWIS